MANFILIYSGGSMPEDTTEIAAVMQAWEVWMKGLGSALIDGGNPFAPAVKHIGSDGKVHDGPIGIPATGYSILKAESLSAALELAKGCPVLRDDGQLTVYETVPVM
jgi:hypothetical protein